MHTKNTARGWTPNEYRIVDNVAYLALTDRSGNVVAETMVDVDDLDRVLTRRWSLDPSGYARSSTEAQGVWDNVALHRFVMRCRPGDGVVVDHRNRDKLDNRQSNLRRGDNVLNSGNRDRLATSRYPGVTWSKGTQRWLAQGRKNGRGYFLGRYVNEEEAAQAYLLWRGREGLPELADPDGRLRRARNWAPETRTPTPATSKYIGVGYCKQTGKWKVQLMDGKRSVWLGRHATEEEAARVAGEWLRAHNRPTLRAVDALRQSRPAESVAERKRPRPDLGEQS